MPDDQGLEALHVGAAYLPKVFALRVLSSELQGAEQRRVVLLDDDQDLVSLEDGDLFHDMAFLWNEGLPLVYLVVPCDQVDAQNLDFFAVIHDDGEDSVLRVDLHDLLNGLRVGKLALELEVPVRILEDLHHGSLRQLSGRLRAI